MSDDSGIPEEPVGVTLARLRRARGLTGAALAALVGMSQPKISRIERGKGLAEPADIGILARALGADQHDVARLMERAERSHDRMTDWRATSNNLALRQTTVSDWEKAATVLSEFQPAVVPGLLQSSGYAAAVLDGFQHLILGDAGAEPAVLAAVAERVRRQQILVDAGKSFAFVITESVLRNEICAPAEMLAQLSRIREVSARPNVSVGVVPDGVRFPLPPMHGFVLFDDSMVILDAFNTGILSRGGKDVATYRRVFEIFEQLAVPPEPFLDRYETHFLQRFRSDRSSS